MAGVGDAAHASQSLQLVRTTVARLNESRKVNRFTTFVFVIFERFFGTPIAYGMSRMGLG